MIRICFSYWGDGKSGLVIYIGKQILSHLGISENGRVRFFVDDENPRQWLIKKSDNTQGYQLTRASKACVKCQITWREDIPHELERKTRLVNFQLSEGIKINAEFHALSPWIPAEEAPINRYLLVQMPERTGCLL